MANNGYSHDKKVINKAIYAGKILQIKQGEHPVARRLKEYINYLIINDELRRNTYGKLRRVTNKINQLRMKYWYWDKIIL